MSIWMNILVVRNLKINASIFSSLFGSINEPKPEAVTDGFVAKTEDGSVDAQSISSQSTDSKVED